MDFKVALIHNANTSDHSSTTSPMAALEVQGGTITTPTLPDGCKETCKETAVKETASKRRRRRRHNNALRHLLGPVKALELERLAGESSSGIYSPKECVADGPPSLNVLLASPTPMPWEDVEAAERVSLNVLKAIADRARERLAIRIQAYRDEKQYVAEAASKIQRAYTQHMESQLQTIIQAMGEHLTREIDTRFAAHSEKSYEVLRQSLAEVRIETTRSQRQDDDKLREHQGRIAALEVQTKSIVDMLKYPPTPLSNVSIVQQDTLVHFHSRTEKLHDLLQDLHLNYQDMMKRMNEMQATLTANVVTRDRKVYSAQATSAHERSPSLVDISNSQSSTRMSSARGSPSHGSKDYSRPPVKRTYSANVVMVGSVECL